MGLRPRARGELEVGATAETRAGKTRTAEEGEWRWNWMRQLVGTMAGGAT